MAEEAPASVPVEGEGEVQTAQESKEAVVGAEVANNNADAPAGSNTAGEDATAGKRTREEEEVNSRHLHIHTAVLTLCMVIQAEAAKRSKAEVTPEMKKYLNELLEEQIKLVPFASALPNCARLIQVPPSAAAIPSCVHSFVTAVLGMLAARD
eukprot:3372685-Rhodomonas_salina.3